MGAPAGPTTAGLVLTAIVASGCGEGEIHRLDLRGLDGVGAVVLLDERGELARGAGLFGIVDGAPELEAPLEGRFDGRLEPRLVLMPPLAHRLGDPILSRSEIRSLGRPVPPLRDGDRLELDVALPPETQILRPTRGPAEALPFRESQAVKANLRIRLSLDTEPCPPPFEPLAPLGLPTFTGLPEAGNGDVVGAHVGPDPDLIVVANTALLALSRGGAPPTSADGPPRGPKDVLLARDLGPRYNAFEGVYGIDAKELLVYGGSPLGGEDRPPAGWLWRVEVSEAGLRVVETATATPLRIMSAATLDGAYYVMDFEGEVFRAPALAGPWTAVAPGVGSKAEDRHLIRGPGRALFRALNSTIEPLPGREPQFEPYTLIASDLSPTGIESAVLDDRGRIWTGTERGQLYLFDGTQVLELGNHLPPRLEGCAIAPPSLDQVRLDRQKVVGLVQHRDWLIAAFERCTALLSLRLGDRCPGLLAAGEDAPGPPEQPFRRLLLAGDRLVLVAEQGQILVAETR